VAARGRPGASAAWVFRLAIRLPLAVLRAARRHPWRAVLFLASVLVVGTGIGAWGYARHQWRAAQVALEQDRPQEARERLQFCLRVWPWSPEVHLRAARAARLSGELQEAEAHLNRCLRLQDGANEGVQLEFLLLRVQTGEVDELAERLFAAVLEGHPESPAILDTIARTYIVRLRYKPAYACLSLWNEKYPEQAKPLVLRGWVLERLGNHKSAYADYYRALELDPDLIPVRLRVAEMLMEDKQAPAAWPHLERLYRQAPENPEVQARVGMCLFLQGRAQEARRFMEAAVVHLQKDPALLVALANLDLQEGRAEDAERRVRTVLKSDPSDSEALFVLASALQFQGRLTEADEVLVDFQHKRQVVEKINSMLKEVADSPKARADDYAEIGELFLEIRREKFGVYWCEQALERDPNNQRAHRALAAYYDGKGDTAKAASHRKLIRGAGH
jgi:tetratricopeptide (TPR) repeat protein